MSTHGLSEKHLEQLHEILRRYPAIEEAILYGSRAKGTHRAFSDIDLSLIGEDISDSILSKLSLALEDSLLPFDVDINEYKALKNEKLIEDIDRVGQCLYRREKA